MPLKNIDSFKREITGLWNFIVVSALFYFLLSPFSNSCWRYGNRRWNFRGIDLSHTQTIYDCLMLFLLSLKLGTIYTFWISYDAVCTRRNKCFWFKKKETTIKLLWFRSRQLSLLHFWWILWAEWLRSLPPIMTTSMWEKRRMRYWC